MDTGQYVDKKYEDLETFEFGLAMKKNAGATITRDDIFAYLIVWLEWRIGVSLDLKSDSEHHYRSLLKKVQEKISDADVLELLDTCIKNNKTNRQNSERNSRQLALSALSGVTPPAPSCVISRVTRKLAESDIINSVWIPLFIDALDEGRKLF